MVTMDLDLSGLENRRQPARNSRRARILLPCLVGLALIAGGIGWDEAQRPGVFYQHIGLPIQDALSFGPSEKEKRSYLLQQARDVAELDGVQRVGWPDLNIHDSNLGLLDTPEGYFTVTTSRNSDLAAIARELNQVVLDAQGAGIYTTITLHGADIDPVSLSPMSDGVLSAALRTAMAANDVEGVEEVALWVGLQSPEEGPFTQQNPARINIWVDDQETADAVSDVVRDAEPSVKSNVIVREP